MTTSSLAHSKERIASKIDALPEEQRERLHAWMMQGINYSEIAKLVRENFGVSISTGSLSTHYSKHCREILGLPSNRPCATWLERRQHLLHAACTVIAALRKNGVRIGCALTLVVRKFRKRSLGGGQRLRLSGKTLRRHWDKWNAAQRDESVFQSRYKPGRHKAALDPALLVSIVERCIQEGSLLAQVLRTFEATAPDGLPLSKQALYRRLPTRGIREIVFSQRRLTRLARDLEQRKAALLKTVSGETSR